MALVALGAAGLVSAPAQATSGRCAPGTGVTVVVDFGSLGGGTRVGCDADGAGRAATRVVPSAGFALTYVNGQPFVCRISGKPGPDEESCATTPPADAYWGLFWSDGTDGTWAYATVGVAGLSVPEGGSIGWRFEDGGADEKPGASPTVGQAAPEPTRPPASPSPTRTPGPGAPPPSTPAPTPPESPTASTPAPTPASSAAGKAGGKPGRSARPSASNRPTGSARPKAAASDHATGDATEAVTDVASPMAADAPESRGADGGNGVTLLAGAAALLLAGAAGVVAWRRRV